MEQHQILFNSYATPVGNTYDYSAASLAFLSLS